MAKTADQRAEPAMKVTSPLIELCGAEKVYGTGRLEYAALRGVDLAIWPGR
jgi:putative ABC transport system ATP-binding protein